MRPATAVAVTSAACLGACGSGVDIRGVEGGETATGRTHFASTTVSVFEMSNPDAGRSRVGRAALAHCGLPDDTPFNIIRLSEGGGLYDHRLYEFSCPQMGKDAL